MLNQYQQGQRAKREHEHEHEHDRMLEETHDWQMGKFVAKCNALLVLIDQDCTTESAYRALIKMWTEEVCFATACVRLGDNKKSPE